MLYQSFLESYFFFSSRRRHTRWPRDWSSDVCSSDLALNRLEAIWVGMQHVRGMLHPHPDRLQPVQRLGLGFREIGRASCRERGSMAGGAVKVKRKERKKKVNSSSGT